MKGDWGKCSAYFSEVDYWNTWDFCANIGAKESYYECLISGIVVVM